METGTKGAESMQMSYAFVKISADTGSFYADIQIFFILL